MVKHVKFLPTDLCPCRSGWMIISCCHDPADNRLRKKIKSIVPPQPVTCYAHPSCYLRGTNDCSQEISHEHYVSANLLEQLGDEGIEVSGLPWLKSGESKRFAIDNLTAKFYAKDIMKVFRRWIRRRESFSGN